MNIVYPYGSTLSPDSNWTNIPLQNDLVYRPYGYTHQVVNDMEIRKVENGFLLKMASKEYVFESTAALTKFIADFYK